MSVAVTVTLALASVMMGEAGVVGPGAALEVGQVALNRLALPEFPGTLLEVLEQGFRGWAEPTEEYIGLAEFVLSGSGDPGGYLYVLGGGDRQRLGFPEGDLVMRRGSWALHFYRCWPEEGARP